MLTGVKTDVTIIAPVMILVTEHKLPPPEFSRSYDVLVRGAGNAAMAAALTARRAGASVLMVESANKDLRGGNSRHVRNIRYTHKAATDYVTGGYEAAEYMTDLMRVTDGNTNEELSRFMIEASETAVDWMIEQGVTFQPPLSGTLGLARTNAFFLGGGKAMMNAYFRTCEKIGVAVVYEAEVEELEIEDGRFNAAFVRHGGELHRVEARTVVLSSGGFESNIEWLKEGWGEAAENFLIRGTPMNTGKVLRAMLNNDAKQIGAVDQCHAVAIDGRAPKFDGGISTRVDCVVFSVVVNKNAERFYDEGEDVWPRRYAIWGRLVAKQPDQIAYSIIDSKSRGLFMPPVFPPIKADTIAGLAEQLELDGTKLEKTISEFNDAVQPGDFVHTELDGCHTEGLEPKKSNWARKIDTPPFYAFPVKTGITFTYLGVEVNKQAQVLMNDGKPAANIWAAGEIMAGNVLGQGYAAGTGMAIGTVFGRIAGEEAARHARN
jgi:tricarballylate dehydrogenase